MSHIEEVPNENDIASNNNSLTSSLEKLASTIGLTFDEKLKMPQKLSLLETEFGERGSGSMKDHTKYLEDSTNGDEKTLVSRIENLADEIGIEDELSSMPLRRKVSRLMSECEV